MSTVRSFPDRSVLSKHFAYNPETGVFSYARDFRRFKKGDAAGTDHGSGYIQIFFGGGKFYAHRLAWWIVNGEIPEGMQIDHIDCNRQNNAIGNLRLARRSEQQRNKVARSDNRSGLKGAIYNSRPGRRKHWRSCIKVDGKTIDLGWFFTAEDAHAAYVAAARAHHGSFARVE